MDTDVVFLLALPNSLAINNNHISFFFVLTGMKKYSKAHRNQKEINMLFELC